MILRLGLALAAVVVTALAVAGAVDPSTARLAVYGFTAMLIKLFADERPDAVVVCFDKGAPQFRLDRYAEWARRDHETTARMARRRIPHELGLQRRASSE